MQKGVQTKTPLPLFEPVEQTPFEYSLFRHKPAVSASSADSTKLLKRVDESLLKTLLFKEKELPAESESSCQIGFSFPVIGK